MFLIQIIAGAIAARKLREEEEARVEAEEAAEPKQELVDEDGDDKPAPGK